MFDNLLDKFTSHFKRILIQAQNIAWQEHSTAIEPVHILEALLQQRGCVGIEIMQKQNVTINSVVFRSPERLNVNLQHDHPSDFWNMPQPSPKSQRIIELAVKTSYEYRHKYVGSEHLLVGIIKIPDAKVRSILTEHNVNTRALLDHIDTVLKSTSRFNTLQPNTHAEHDHDTETALEQGSSSMLELFTTDLTNKTIQKDIDPVIGRGREIES